MASLDVKTNSTVEATASIEQLVSACEKLQAMFSQVASSVNGYANSMKNVKNAVDSVSSSAKKLDAMSTTKSVKQVSDLNGSLEKTSNLFTRVKDAIVDFFASFPGGSILLDGLLGLGSNILGKVKGGIFDAFFKDFDMGEQIKSIKTDVSKFFTEMKKGFDKVGFEKVYGFGVLIKDIFKDPLGYLDIFKYSVVTKLTGLKDLILPPFKVIGTTLTNLFKDPLGTIGGLFKGLGTVAGGVLKSIKTFTLTVFSPFNILIGLIVGLVGGFVYLMATSEEFRDKVFGYVSEIWGNFKTLGKNLMDGFIKPLIATFKNFITSLWDNGLKTFVISATEFLFELFIFIQEIINWVVTYVLPLIIPVLDVIMGYIGIVAGFIANIVAFIIDLFKGIIRFLNEVLLPGWTGLWTGVANILIDIWNRIVGATEWFVNLIIGAINMLLEKFKAINGVLEWAGLNFRVETIQEVSLGRVPRFRTGGGVRTDTLARIGDYAGVANNPEWVLRTDQLQSLIDFTAAQGGSSGEEMQLMMEQNQLLRELLQKDTTVRIGDRDIAKANQRGSRQLGYAVNK